MTRHFLADDDLTPQEYGTVLDLAADLKRAPYAKGVLDGPQGVAILFDKPSTRTRASFSLGVAQLGGFPLVIDAGTSQLSRGESIPDTVRVLARQCVAIVWRTGAHARLTEAAGHSQVPIVNALSEDYHPCQVLADALTLREHLGDLRGRTFAFFGDTACNMAHSYALGLTTAGMHVRLCGPTDYAPAPHVLARAEATAAKTGGSISVLTEPERAADGADVLATDTWTSMGSTDADKRRVDLAPYQLNAALVKNANNPTVLHCLPAHRGEEITSDVIEGPHSVVFDQAENRLHAQKALLTFLLERQ